MTALAPVLQAKDLVKSFGGVRALDGVSLGLAPGQGLGVIGPNGSGKTTLLNVITGFIRPDQGEVRLNGDAVTGIPPHAVAAKGLSRTFQTPRPMAGLSPLENMVVALKGARRKTGEPGLHGKRILSRAVDILESVGLANYTRSRTPAGDLTLAESRRLELARCLALNPGVILFDELFSGLSQDEADQLAGLVLSIRQSGVAMILVEHRLSHLFRLVDKVMVLDFGRCIFEGKPNAALASSLVRDAYFGLKEGEDHAQD